MTNALSFGGSPVKKASVRPSGLGCFTLLSRVWERLNEPIARLTKPSPHFLAEYCTHSLAPSLTVDLDGEVGLDLSPDVARLAAVDALVLVAPQVGDDQRRLHPVAVLVVRRQQDVVVLSLDKTSFSP